MTALDDQDYRSAEACLAQLVADDGLFASLAQVVATGDQEDIRRAGVQVECFLLRGVVRANGSQQEVLAAAKQIAGIQARQTLETSWNARPRFDPYRMQQRLREMNLTLGRTVQRGT